MQRVPGLLATLFVWLAVAPASAYDGPVEKKTFPMPSYTTVNGHTIKNVRVGWESYGRLNAAKDNVILVTHFFSGTSHAAGKYAPADAASGYWDAIIGSGKPIDTDRFVVGSSDTLVNLNVKDPSVVTTGPASTNPDTGKPYGMSFPIVTIRDSVNAQKALLDSLGITKLHAVAGASMGSLQAYEWAAAYPDMVPRIIPVIPAAQANAFLIAWLDVWSAPITLDPHWNNGDYYGKQEPLQGLALALKTVTIHARHWGWADKAFGHKGTLEDGFKNVKAKVLMLPAASDLLLSPAWSKDAMDFLKKQGRSVEYAEIAGDGGHLDGVLAITSAGETIRKFLGQ